MFKIVFLKLIFKGYLIWWRCTMCVSVFIYMSSYLLVVHFISNWIAGFCFFGVAYFLNAFINRVLANTRHEDRLTNPIWIAISKQSSLFIIMTFVFFFCGLGHILHGIEPWTHDYLHLQVILILNAVCGLTLVIKLWRMFYGGRHSK